MSLKIVNTKVAVFRDTQFAWDCVYAEHMEDRCGLVRVSEFVEVFFLPRAEEEIIPAILAGLDEEANKIREEAIEKLNRIAAQKAEVLQITYVPSEEL